MTRLEALALLLVACGCSIAVAAQTLPPELRQRQAALSPAQRQELTARAQTLQAMSASQRRVLEHRLRQWQALGERERRTRRERWQAWQALPQGERQRIRQAARAFEMLPVPERQQLRERYAQLSTDQRRGWLLGPELGADYPDLAPLISQVPAEQRTALLSVLRAMTAQQRSDLGVLARRVPPQQRDQLRTELLRTTAANRSDWLYSWLDR